MKLLPAHANCSRPHFPNQHRGFCVTGVEALAAGTLLLPTLKAARGLRHSWQNRALFKKQTVESLVETLQDFKPERYDPAKLREFSKDFSVRAFRKRMQDVINAPQPIKQQPLHGRRASIFHHHHRTANSSPKKWWRFCCQIST